MRKRRRKKERTEDRVRRLHVGPQKGGRRLKDIVPIEGEK